jgi:hypothetical protein
MTKYQECSSGPIIEKPNPLSIVTTPQFLQLLTKMAGTPTLPLMFNLSVRSGGLLLLTITSNYTYRKDWKSIFKGQIDALDQYLKKHGIVQDSPAWYLDYESYKWRRISSPYPLGG